MRVAGRIHLRCLTILELAILAIIIGNLVQLKIFRCLLLATYTNNPPLFTNLIFTHNKALLIAGFCVLAAL